MAEEKLTIWQRLGKGFGPNSLLNQEVPTLKFDKNILLKTNDKAEYQKEKLQAQQTAYLTNQWAKIENNLYTQSVYYEPTRLASYYDYESMEYFPEIASALDTFSEESTTVDQNGEMLQIYSESKRIKSILTDLFYNQLDVNTNLSMWTRNTCKYGDDFVFLKLDPEKGVVGCFQLPNIEIERIEKGMLKRPGGTSNNDPELKQLKFSWKQKNLEFNTWEVAHFRLLGDDRKLPYGTCLKGDTRVTTENSVKEIKDLQKGDLVWSFDEKTQEKTLSKILDTINSGIKTCYRVSTKHNFFEASEEHRIMIVDNKTNTGFNYVNVKNLRLGDQLVIDVEINTNNNIKIDRGFPNENKNGWFNRCEELIPEYITEEFAQLFGFMYGDGWLNTHTPSLSIALGVDETINLYYINLLRKFSGTEGVIVNNGRQFTIYSKLLKTIFIRMGFGGKFNEKRIPNWVYTSSINIQEAFIGGLIDADGWESEDEWTKAFHIELANEQLIKDIKILIQRMGYKSGKIGSRTRKNNKGIDGRMFKTTNTSYYLVFYYTKNKQTLKNDINNRLTNNFITEKIISIEEIGQHETFDIYVENENHNFYANGIVVHNSILEKVRRIWKQLVLAEDAMLIYRTSRAPERRVFKVFVGNMDDKDVEAYVQRFANKFKRDQVTDSKTGNVDLRYNQMAVDQDYFVPVRDVAAPNPIDTLPGAQNLSEIADIEYLQKKLLTALRVPKAFLGFEEVVADGKNLALQDIRFARTINRIQKSMLAELNKIAIIHLFLLGFEDELSNFTLGLSNPSTQADLLKVDVWKEKMLLYKDTVTAIEGIAPTSQSWAKKHILGFSDDEIKLDIQQQRIERAVAKELENTATIIPRTGIFDSIDAIYGQKGGTTPPPGNPQEPTVDMSMPSEPSLGGGSIPEIPETPPAAPEEGGAPPEAAPETVPESIEDRINILVEGGMFKQDEVINLNKGRTQLGEIEKELGKLLKS